MQTVNEFFESYSYALLSLSAEQITSHYQVPLAIYSDQGVRCVTKESETLAFWKEGVKPYAKMHITRTEFEILSEEQLTSTVYISKVLWKNFDKTGKEVAREINLYILSAGKEKLKISGLVIMAQ